MPAVSPSASRWTLQWSDGLAVLDDRGHAHALSAAAFRRRLVAIDGDLEGIDAEAVEGFDETLVFLALGDVEADEGLDDVRHFLRGERAADHLAELRLVALTAAERDLVPLLVALSTPRMPMWPTWMVTAGVHAAGQVELDVADVPQMVEILEARLNGPATGIERALARSQKSPPGQQIMSVSRPMFGVAKPAAGLPARVEEAALFDVGEHQVLLVRDAQFAKAVVVGEVGGGIHLFRGDVARAVPGFLQRQRDRRIAGDTVRTHVALDPAGEGHRTGLLAHENSHRSPAAIQAGGSKQAATRSYSACVMVAGPPAQGALRHPPGVRTRPGACTRILMRAL